MLLRVVKRDCDLQQRECFKPIVKEEVYGLIVETENQGFEEVDKIIGKLFILRELEFILDELREEWITQYVE